MNRFAFVALVLAACGGSTFSSSIDGDLTLAELDETQACTLQEEQEDYLVDAFSTSQACYLASQFTAAFAVAFDETADFTAVCEETYDECMADDSSEPGAFECVEPTVPEGCSYTVADFETCQTEAVDLLKDVVSAGCAEPEDTTDETTGLSATCEAIQTECGIYFY